MKQEQKRKKERRRNRMKNSKEREEKRRLFVSLCAILGWVRKRQRIRRRRRKRERDGDAGARAISQQLCRFKLSLSYVNVCVAAFLEIRNRSGWNMEHERRKIVNMYLSFSLSFFLGSFLPVLFSSVRSEDDRNSEELLLLHDVLYYFALSLFLCMWLSLCWCLCVCVFKS